MPPYEVTSPWDAATSAAGSFMSGMQDERKYAAEQGKQRRAEAYQQALASQGAARLQLEQNADARATTKAGDEEADRKTSIDQATAIGTTLSGLKPFAKPPNFAQLPREQQYRMQADYYRQYIPTWQKLPGNEANTAKLIESVKNLDEEADKERAASALSQHEGAVATALAKHEAAVAAALAHNEQQNRDQRTTISNNDIGAANQRFATGQAGDDNREQLRIGAAATAAHISRRFQQTEKDRTFAEQEKQIRLRGDISAQNAAKRAGGAGKIDPVHLHEWQTLNSGITGLRLSSLSPKVINTVQTGVYSYGLKDTLEHLQATASGQAQTPGITPAEAAAAVKALSGGR